MNQHRPTVLAYFNDWTNPVGQLVVGLQRRNEVMKWEAEDERVLISNLGYICRVEAKSYTKGSCRGELHGSFYKKADKVRKKILWTISCCMGSK